MAPLQQYGDWLREIQAYVITSGSLASVKVVTVVLRSGDPAHWREFEDNLSETLSLESPFDVRVFEDVTTCGAFVEKINKITMDPPLDHGERRVNIFLDAIDLTPGTWGDSVRASR